MTNRIYLVTRTEANFGECKACVVIAKDRNEALTVSQDRGQFFRDTTEIELVGKTSKGKGIVLDAWNSD